MSQSSRIIKYYRRLHYWCSGLEKAAACYRAEEEAGVTYTDDERAKVCEANRHLETAKRLVNEVYATRIGKAVTSDIRSGERIAG